MKKVIAAMAVALVMISCNEAPKTYEVAFNDDPVNKKVDVLIDGKYFTSYIYPDNMEKQVLNPIMTASGKEITRGYPLNPRPFERVDHPHHVGHWLNFGDVNGLDFWNNSFAIPAERKHRYGTVKFKEIVKQDPANGDLVVAADWVNQGDTVLLNEVTTFHFAGAENLRTIERTTKLTAQTDVTMTQNKEGLVAIRMDRAFEEPSDRPQKYTDANGIETEVAVVNNEGVNGVYRNAEQVVGADVWSKRSPWVALRAEKEGEIITVAILDNKANVGYPAWSHARGYGLFATNNLGGQAFDKEVPELKVVLKPGESVTFKHLIVIGGDLTDEELNQMAADFK